MVTLLRSHGVHTVILDHDAATVAEQLRGVSGVVMMGNRWDIDPAEYGEASCPADICIPEDPAELQAYRARMAFERRLSEAAFDQKIPLLGICGGMQRINITGEDAGTLKTLEHEEHDTSAPHPHCITPDIIPPYTPVQLVQIQPHTGLADIAQSQKHLYKPLGNALPDDVHMVNSLHHQAVGTLKDGFEVAAIAPDGVIEAIAAKRDGKYGDHCVLGVQWHPEFGTTSLSDKIVHAFAEECRRFARQHTLEREFTDEVIRRNLPQPLLEHIDAGIEHIGRVFEGAKEGMLARP
jgi:putative glutamine amidotransferase